MLAIAPVGIVVALDAEARSCARWQRAANARLALTGPGFQRAEDGARKLVEQGVSCLVSWGTSGALAPGLVAGQLLLIATTSRLGYSSYRANADLLGISAALLSPLAPREVIACTVALPVSNFDGKQALAARGADCVDMETAAVAGVAEQAGLPFLGIRSVVDPVQCEIPAAALAGMGEDGRSYPLRTVAALMRRPGDLPALLRLGLNYRAALKTLTRAAGLLGAATTQPGYVRAFQP